MWAMDGLTTDPTFSDTPMVWNRAALNNVNTLTACSDLKSLSHKQLHEDACSKIFKPLFTRPCLQFLAPLEGEAGKATKPAVQMSC